MKRVALYIRVSTQEQAQEGYSIHAQTERLKAYCTAREWQVVKIYTDPGYSGAKLDRPAMQDMLLDIQSGAFDIVLVYKLDRLSRSQKDTLYLIEDVFLKNNVAFVSVNENFDTSTAFGRAMIGILSVFAQLEREQIKERMQMGLIERAKEGYFHGGPYYPIGYDYIDGELIVNDYEAMQIKMIYDMYAKGESTHSIYKYLRENNFTNKYSSWKHPSMIAQVLRNRIYIGFVSYCGTEYKGRHTPIIDMETYDAVQKRLTDPRRFRSSNCEKPFTPTRLLSGGMLKCGVCGSTFHARGVWGGHEPNKIYRPYYICYSVSKSSKERIKDKNCKSRMISTSGLDYLVVSEIRKLAMDEDYFIKTSKPKESKAEKGKSEILRKRIEEIDAQTKRVTDLYQLGTLSLDEISSRLDKLNEEKKSLLRQIAESKAGDSSMDMDTAQDLLSSAIDIFNNGSLKEQREFIKKLIDKIVITPDDIKIHWAFARKNSIE